MLEGGDLLIEDDLTDELPHALLVKVEILKALLALLLRHRLLSLLLGSLLVLSRYH